MSINATNYNICTGFYTKMYLSLTIHRIFFSFTIILLCTYVITYTYIIITVSTKTNNRNTLKTLKTVHRFETESMLHPCKKSFSPQLRLPADVATGHQRQARFLSANELRFPFS